MLNQIKKRRVDVGLSVRGLAAEVGVSPALLSLTLTGKRQPSDRLTRKLTAWLATPVVTSHDHAPGTLYHRFIFEKRSQLAPLTAKFYEAKLAPFVLWCEQYRITDIARADRATVIEFLASIRAGRRKLSNGNVKALNNGALKLHHQCLKTFFNWVGETISMPDGWRSPLEAIRVKPSQTETMAYGEAEIRRIFEIDVPPEHVAIGSRVGCLPGTEYRITCIRFPTA